MTKKFEVTILDRIRWTISQAYQGIPSYRRLLDSHHLSPSAIRSMSHFQKLPFTDSSIFMNPSCPYLALPLTAISKLVYSQPPHPLLGFTDNDLYCLGQSAKRMFMQMDAMPYALAQIQRGYEGLLGGLKELHITAVEFTDHPYSTLMGSTAILAGGGDVIDNALKNTPFPNMRIVLSKDEIMESDKKSLYSTYKLIDCGLSLGGGIGFATSDGELFISNDYYYYEMLPVSPASKKQRLVVTTLTCEAMPLVRYQTEIIL